jgi:2-keto-4-pentenoate hydratase/2-oxohepta-3-ene-1,7-dioic acid hydratase in catechol pathway
MKIICIGRNYAAHAAEMKSSVPENPMIFMKPPTALLLKDKPMYIPEFTENLHYEAEIVLKIAKNGRHVQEQFASEYYHQIAFGIDFTARDLQSQLKEKGHPWEIAKGFDHSAGLSEFVNMSDLNDAEHIQFHLDLNGETVQKGNTKNLIFTFNTLIVYISKFFKLQQGDIIYTGTPSGVGPLKIGDKLEGYIEGKKMLSCDIK